MNKVENTSYLKDPKTGVIINSNEIEYNNARSRRSKQKRDQLKVKTLENELAQMKEDMAILMNMVKGNTNGN